MTDKHLAGVERVPVAAMGWLRTRSTLMRCGLHQFTDCRAAHSSGHRRQRSQPCTAHYWDALSRGTFQPATMA